MNTSLVSSMLEMCALHTEALVRQPTHVLNETTPHCLTLQITTSSDSTVVVHDIIMTSSSTGQAVDVVYGTQLQDSAERFYWNERAGRFLARPAKSAGKNDKHFFPESQSYS